jgi:hypothetical protein
MTFDDASIVAGLTMLLLFVAWMGMRYYSRGA